MRSISASIMQSMGNSACIMQLRKLLTTFKEEREKGNEDPQLLRKLRQDIFPELPPLNETVGPEELKEKILGLQKKREEIEAMKRKLQALRDSAEGKAKSEANDQTEPLARPQAQAAGGEQRR
jgi:hypothetical protein